MVGRLRRAGCRRHPRRTPAVNDDQRHRRAGQLPPDPEWPGALGGRAPSLRIVAVIHPWTSLVSNREFHVSWTGIGVRIDSAGDAAAADR